MKLRTPLAIASVALAGGLGLALPAVAYACNSHDITPGAACSTPGAIGYKNGHEYICQQKQSDDCPIWHHVPQPGAHGTPWSHGPCCTPKPSATPAPSHTTPTHPYPSHSHTRTPSFTPSTTPSSHSASPSGSASVAGSPSTMPAAPSVAGTPGTDTMLPITGPDLSTVLIVGGVGALMVATGGLVIVLVRRRTT